MSEEMKAHLAHLDYQGLELLCSSDGVNWTAVCDDCFNTDNPEYQYKVQPKP